MTKFGGVQWWSGKFPFMVKRQETACVGLSTSLADSPAIVDLARAHQIGYISLTIVLSKLNCYHSLIFHGPGHLVLPQWLTVFTINSMLLTA